LKVTTITNPIESVIDTSNISLGLFNSTFPLRAKSKIKVMSKATTATILPAGLYLYSNQLFPLLLINIFFDMKPATKGSPINTKYRNQ
jgi:hypothetical protein